jgi:hypothetical protein
VGIRQKKNVAAMASELVKKLIIDNLNASWAMWNLNSVIFSIVPNFDG